VKNKQQKIGDAVEKRGGNLGSGIFWWKLWPLWWVQGGERGTMDEVSKFLQVAVLIRREGSFYILSNSLSWCLEF